MREIRPYGSEGGVALTTPFLPLSYKVAVGSDHFGVSNFP